MILYNLKFFAFLVKEIIVQISLLVLELIKDFSDLIFFLILLV